MGHNPPRPQSLDADSMRRIAEEIQPRRKPWRDYADLGNAIALEARAGKRVVLSPDTALMVASVLDRTDIKPDRDEIAMMICRQACKAPCYSCTGRANVIVAAYGCRVQL